ncbi:hypothetical protein Poly41_58860 [Novipirellula artificiosorum]|uniref:Uncharacterized protein n=1 Tax=Novipirellula artificiosorum TaxID=2528016 RepID=A0A5C6D5C0_9BACT|nr:hypothetical protein Poly41_58860 [Novipirellula artificiosorum]
MADHYGSLLRGASSKTTSTFALAFKELQRVGTSVANVKPIPVVIQLRRLDCTGDPFSGGAKNGALLKNSAKSENLPLTVVRICA